MSASLTKTAHMEPADMRHSSESGSDVGMAVLRLDGRGLVCDCNRLVEKLFNYTRSQLVWQHVSLLLPELADLELLHDGQANMHLRFLSHVGHHFQAITQDGKRFASKIFLNVIDSAGNGQLSLIVRPAEKAAGQGAPGIGMHEDNGLLHEKAKGGKDGHDTTGD